MLQATPPAPIPGSWQEHRLGWQAAHAGWHSQHRWCELQAVTRDMQEVGTQVETVWSKGHPEKYKKRKDWTVHDFMNDRVDKLAETQYGREKPRGQGLTYSHGPSWEIEHRGTVRMLRGNWRKRLKIY